MSEKFEPPVMDENPASQRHWLYGFNAFVLVLVGLIVLGFLLRICETDAVKNNTKFDWSSSGVNSLSGGTRKMLDSLNAKAEKFTIWSLFIDASDQIKRELPEKAAEFARRRQQINDLLKQYQRASSNITVDDRGDASMDEIERQISIRYADEFTPYQDAMSGQKGFSALVEKLSKFFKDESVAIGANGQKPGTSQLELEFSATLQSQFVDWEAELAQVQKRLQREADEKLPDWGGIKAVIGMIVDDMLVKFELLSDPKKLEALAESKSFPKTLATYFISANKEYKDIHDALKEYQDKLNKLQPLKCQEILSGLARNTVIILGDKSAKVVPPQKLYREVSADRSGQGAGLSFTGEQGISSALLSMVKPEKVQVVFVSPTPMRLLEDLYSGMKEVLEDNNFEVLEWSPPTPPQPGRPPEPSGPPPAEGKGVVWVVFPPDPPMGMMMMPPDARPVISATRAHMNQGGQVLFMAEGGGGGMGALGGMEYPYAELIKDFGIEVQNKYSMVYAVERTDPNTGRSVKQPFPYLGMDMPMRFAKHPITTPVEGMPTIFGPLNSSQGPMGSLVPVKVLTPLPANISAMEIVMSPDSPEYWGAADATVQPLKFDKTKDLGPPVPLMAVAIKDQGKKAADGSSDEKRIAVLGCKLLGANPFIDSPAVDSRGQVVPRFPGNMELMKNTVLWLSVYENMIAVSARANSEARIQNVTKNQMTFIRLIVLLFAPLLALIIGGVVWTVRRR